MRAGAIKAALASLPLRALDDILAPGPLLVLAPHPDDESLGCGGLLAAAVAQGRAAHVAILTDGSRSHPGSRDWPPHRLASLREAEARRAVAELGLPDSEPVFLRAPDGAAPHDGDGFAALLERLHAIVVAHRIATVCASWRHDPHCDHDAAAKLAAALCRRTGARHLSYPVWTWMLPDDQDVPGAAPRGARIDIAGYLPAKRRAIAAHASQAGLVVADAPDGFRLAADFLALFDRPWEVLIETP